MTVANGELVKRISVMGSLAEKYQVDPNKLLETIRHTCITSGNASMEQIQAFCIVANNYDLNPFLKEIYAFPAKGGGIVPVVGIDGWSRIINRTNMVNGIDFTFSGEGKSLACTCSLWIKGRDMPTRVTEYYEECFRNTDPWKGMPRRMLRHKSLIQCARVAFSLGGIYDEDEAKDIINNESGRTTGIRRLDELNAAVVPHPTAPTQTIDTSDSNLPPAEKAEQVIRDAPRAPEQGKEVIALTFDVFVSMAEEIAKTAKVSPEVFDAAVTKLRLSNGGGKRKDGEERAALIEAMEAGDFNWQTAKIKEVESV